MNIKIIQKSSASEFLETGRTLHEVHNTGNSTMRMLGIFPTSESMVIWID